ncbi:MULTISPECIES: hypothetical protein [unclassified Streptomyces]|uniref:hypothetical protein n=1 Tax=unclassified Streptomyces TaxID=2593676 RepID=UPI003423216C
MSDPIIPTRIIPAGHAIPTAPPLPPAPPGSTNLPPWRTAAPAAPVPPVAPPPVAPAPAPDPAPIAVRVTVDMVYPEPEPEPGRWARLWNAVTARVKPWQAVVALVAAVVPVPWTGYSAATTWVYTMSEARELHVAAGYCLAVGVFALTVRRFAKSHGVVALWGVAVTGIGLFGAISWYDVVVVVTGVHR